MLSGKFQKSTVQKCEVAGHSEQLDEISHDPLGPPGTGPPTPPRFVQRLHTVDVPPPVPQSHARYQVDCGGRDALVVLDNGPTAQGWGRRQCGATEEKLDLLPLGER